MLGREVDNWAWEIGREQKLKPAVRLTLLALAAEAWKSNWCAIVNIDAIGEETGIPYRTLRRYLDELAEAGLVRRARLRKPNGHLAGYAFWLNPIADAEWPIMHLRDGFSILEDSADGVTRIAAAAPGAKLDAGVNQGPNGVGNGHANKRKQYSSEHSSEEMSEAPPRRRRKQASLPPDFEEFWATGTHKMRERSDAKAAVERIFRPIAQEVGAHALTAALRAYCATEDVQSGMGQPGYQVWLRKGRYEQFLPRPITDEQWRQALAHHLNAPTWWREAGHRKFGPPPGQPGCRVPVHILNEFASRLAGERPKQAVGA